MKPLHVLAALLFLALAIGLIGVVVTNSDRTLAKSSDDGAVAAQAGVQAGLSLDGDRPCPDEIQLRRIIREELAAMPAAMLARQSSQDTSVASRSPTEGAGFKQSEFVDRQIDDYIRAGTITESEMAALQGEIARLDEAGRRQALGKLVRAINSGLLEGRL
ncbi:MAG: hypothetical protein WAW79_10385 [Steroidobacteraceae bacterium]